MEEKSREKHGEDEETTDMISISFKSRGKRFPLVIRLDFLHCYRCLCDADLALPKGHQVFCHRDC